jgi:predicted Zn-dependent protease
VKRALLAVLALIFLGIVGLLAARWPGGSVYLVPLGPVPPTTLDTLAAHVQTKFDLKVTILSEVPPESRTRDRQRRQLIAEELRSLMKREHWWQAWNPRATLIGITPYDMYAPERPEWAFVFNWQGGRSAVISMKRLDPVNLGDPEDAGLFQQRLRKVVMRDIGFNLFLREPSTNPRSVLFGPLLGVDDIDKLGEDF